MELWLLVAAFLITADILVICKLIINRLKYKDKKASSRKNENLLLEIACAEENNNHRKVSELDYFRMKQAIRFDEKMRSQIEKAIDMGGIERKSLKGLASGRKIIKLRAIVTLGLLATDNARMALEKAILTEKDITVKLYIANSLSDIGNSESIPVLAASLINSHRFYRSKVNMLLAEFGDSFNSFIPLIADSRHIEMKELVVDFAESFFSEYTKSYMIKLVKTRTEELKKLAEFYRPGTKCCTNCIHLAVNHDKLYCKYLGEVKPDFLCRRYKVLPVSINPEKSHLSLVYKACDILATYYPEVLDQEEYLNSEDITIRNSAVKALGNRKLGSPVDKLLTLIGDEATGRTAGNVLSIIIEQTPKVLLKVAESFHHETDFNRKKEFARILSSRIEYFILKLSTQDRKESIGIIKGILYLGRTSEIIDFLNKNKDVDLENELLVIVREVIEDREEIKKEFNEFLRDRLVHKCGLTPRLTVSEGKVEKKDKKLKKNLIIILAISLLLTPIAYVIRYWGQLPARTFTEHLIQFVIDFNYYLAFYSLTINMTYLILLLLSNRHARYQEEMWKIKNMSLLFKKKMLPSVSIIAPAYNEEKTIIESANSLLNLKYPDYELIFVNDGSKDNTLDTLIRYFNLKRVDYLFDYRLNTKPVRGVYRNRSLPKLIVVDKDNGGKADSLNAGINIANKEYFCGIDADSLLEDEALLRLAALTLDEGIETPALGGNILPINGCEVEHGQIKKVMIPQNRLARLQTIEYLRAFMAGRLGWAKLNSLLIISGAFGLFRKERVVSVGGYLTSSGKYEKDTVGEDMELVVRISRLMRELGLRFKIRYGYNANCWTEVPEDIKTLRKQRYRWHKGLIDILTFHRKMIFNPRYGRVGLLAMPYFFLFEMFGPMLEFQGYVMVVLALLFGLLNAKILLILFVCTILLGILISVSSLVIAERDIQSFRFKDLMILIGYAFIENFGPRQRISFWRVGGYLNMLKKPGGWDKAERKGFKNGTR